MDAPYAPARDPIAKVQRRLVQWRAARPHTFRFDKPVVSFTFDDFPRSAAKAGAQVLEAAGGRGTYYVSMGALGEKSHLGPMFERDDLLRLVEHGHEIGCHTRQHLDGARCAPDDMLADMTENAHALGQIGFDGPLSSFAYPYGETSLALKRALPQRFRSARGTIAGLNIGAGDLAQLRANAMFGPNAMKRCLRKLEEAMRQNAWIIFFTHDVAARPSQWGSETRVLERLALSCVANGVDIKPVGQVVQTLLERESKS